MSLAAIRRHVSAMLLVLVAMHAGAYNVDDSLKAVYDSPDGDAIEGVWQLLPGDAVIGIRATSPGHYDIRLIDSPAPALLPGTLVGNLVRAAKPCTYDGNLHLKKYRKMKCTVEVDDEHGRMQFYQYHKRIGLNMWHLAPWLFRYSVTYKDTRPEGIDGALRLWPRPGRLNPVQL